MRRNAVHFIFIVSILTAQAPGLQQAGAAPTLPQNAPSRELILKTWVDVEDLRSDTKSMLETVREEIKRRFEAKEPRNQELIKIVDETFEEMIQDQPIDDLIEAVVRVAQRHLTEADLQALATYRASPEGLSAEKKVKNIVPLLFRALDPQQEKDMAASPLAQDAPDEDAVARLMDATEARKMALATERAVSQQFNPNHANNGEDSEQFDRAMRAIALVYRHLFTAAEVNARIAFYSSVAGKNLLNANQDLPAEIARAEESAARKFEKSFRRRLAEYNTRHGAPK